MKRLRNIFIIITLFSNSLIFQGCWNYREIEKMGIVAGVAIDKGEEGRISMTVEMVEFTNEKESKVNSKLISVEGNTIFEAARNAITINGKKLYWSHAKVVIISEKVAREGIVSVLDWFSRDSETRADIRVLVTKGCEAKGILKNAEKLGPVHSFALREMIDNQKSLSKAPKVELWQVINDLSISGKSAIAPVVHQIRENDVLIPQILGTAIFSKDKLVGYLSDEETKDMLFVQNELKGGILAHVDTGSKGEIPISLEIFKSKTKQEIDLEDGEVHVNVLITTTVAIDEIGASENIMEESRRKELERSVDKISGDRIERFIKKVQLEYGLDIFGFGATFRERNPKAWKKVSKNWPEKFKDASVKVSMNVHIRNSAMLSKPMEVGD